MIINHNTLKQRKAFDQFFIFEDHLSKLAFLGVLFVFVFSPLFVSAQIKSDFGVAYTYSIIDENFDYGDIISYDKDTGVHSLSKVDSDSNMFGVAVETPVLLFRAGSESGVPIIQSGKALVNVTTSNGPIRVGDYITSSSIPGKGQRADGKNVFVLGFAMESFGEGVDIKSGEVLSGKIMVMLNIEEIKDASVGASTDNGLNIPFIVGSGSAGPGDGGSQAGDGSGGVNIIKYSIAALIAITSIFIALRNFMSVINKGIVSVGRNPLAKSSVWSIVVFNTIIALVISIIGIFLSLIIISLPY